MDIYCLTPIRCFRAVFSETHRNDICKLLLVIIPIYGITYDNIISVLTHNMNEVKINCRKTFSGFQMSDEMIEYDRYIIIMELGEYLAALIKYGYVCVGKPKHRRIYEIKNGHKNTK
jgi:hypothetical protein